MNSHTTALPTPPRSAAELDALQTRFALRLSARLTEQSQAVSPDISERLRFAREQALARARTKLAAETAGAVSRSGPSLALLGGWGVKIASVLPLVVLAAGLILIQRWHSSTQISAAAEIDASLLSDDVPPDAYSDPGFVEFLKTPRD
ncbi:DUF3619 family protein [Rhizobacter sp. P5_C2]|jgi:hypothetical protein